MQRLVPVVLCLGLAACKTTHLYDVSASKDVGGVPFYVLEQYDVATGVYYETFYRLDITATVRPQAPAPGKGQPGPGKGKQAPAPATVTRTVTVYDSDEKEVGQVYSHFILATNFDKAWVDTGDFMIGKLKANGNAPAAGPVPNPEVSLVPFPPIASPARLLKATLIGTSKTRTQIPSAKPAYYNITIPSGGQASGEVDLNADGTLGKGVSSKQDSLPGTIATAVGTLGAAALGAPLAQIFSHVFPTPAAATAAAAGPQAATANGLNGFDMVGVDLKITPIVRVYTVSLSHAADDSKGCDSWRASTTSLESTDTCWATVSMALKGDTDGAGSGKDANNITFNGSVTLPPPPKPGK